MQSEPKYESLDIEQLLLHKSFYELADDEREFAMQHIDSEQEYEDMRKTLLNIEFSSQSEELIAPPPRIKEELMAAFDDESDRKPIVIWLNGVNAKLFPDGKSFYRQPGFQAAVAAMIVVAFLVLRPTDDPSIVGHDMVASNESQQAPLEQKMVATDSTVLPASEETTEEADTRTNTTWLSENNAQNSPTAGGVGSPDEHQPAAPPALDDAEIMVADMVLETEEEEPAREMLSADVPTFDPATIANNRDSKDAEETKPQGTSGAGTSYYETGKLAQEDFEYKGKVSSQLDSVSYDRYRADGTYKLDNAEGDVAMNDEVADEITFDADDLAFGQANEDAEKDKLKKERQAGTSSMGVRGGNTSTTTGTDGELKEQPNSLMELAAQSADKTNRNNAQEIETTALEVEAEIAEAEEVRLEDNNNANADASAPATTATSTNSVYSNKRPAGKATTAADTKNTDLIRGRSLNDDKALIKTFFTAL